MCIVDKIFGGGAGEVAQLLTALDAPVENLGSVPSTHISKLTAIYNSSS